MSGGMDIPGDPGPDAPKKKAGRPRGSGTKLQARPPIRTVRDRLETRPPVADSVAEAEAYAAEHRDAFLAGMDLGSEFDLPPGLAPDGWIYEWKRITVAGAPDPYHQMHLKGQGWREVPSSRHLELCPDGWSVPTIDKKGLRLMELPAILVKEAQKRQRLEARDAVRNSEQKLFETPANTAPREEFPEQKRQFSREWHRPVGAPVEAD